MTKKPTKPKPSRALTRVAPPPAPFAGTTIMPSAVYYNDRRPTAHGPWKNERDKIAWIDAQTGLNCIILRQPEGHLAGFVAVGADHPLHSFRYDAVPGHITQGMHNPLFHSAACEWADERVSICHVPPGAQTTPSMRAHRQAQTANPIYNSRTEQQHDEAWWFGFECDGPQDLIPTPRHRSNRLTEERGQVYRGEAFVYAEVTALAARLKAAERDVLAYPATAASGDPLSGIHASGIDALGINAGTPIGPIAALPAPDAASISSQMKEDGQ